jgi:large subunit ribosomal protein MRP49
MLPRIKYRNPNIPIAIQRHNDAEGPSLLHIYTSSTSPDPAATTTPNPQSTPTHTFDLKMKHESEILDLLIEKTGATPLQATPQELAEQEEIAEFKTKSEKDRVEVRDKLIRVRREEELLRLARGEVPATA